MDSWDYDGVASNRATFGKARDMSTAARTVGRRIGGLLLGGSGLTPPLDGPEAPARRVGDGPDVVAVSRHQVGPRRIFRRRLVAGADIPCRRSCRRLRHGRLRG